MISLAEVSGLAMKTILLKLDGAVVMALEHAFALAPLDAPHNVALFADRLRGASAKGRCDLEIPARAAEQIEKFLASLPSTDSVQTVGTLTIHQLLEQWRLALGRKVVS